MTTKLDTERWFALQREQLTQQQTDAMRALLTGGKALAEAILATTPHSAERTQALLLIRQATHLCADAICGQTFTHRVHETWESISAGFDGELVEESEVEVCVSTEDSDGCDDAAEVRTPQDSRLGARLGAAIQCLIDRGVWRCEERSPFVQLHGEVGIVDVPIETRDHVPKSGLVFDVRGHRVGVSGVWGPGDALYVRLHVWEDGEERPSWASCSEEEAKGAVLRVLAALGLILIDPPAVYARYGELHFRMSVRVDGHPDRSIIGRDFPVVYPGPDGWRVLINDRTGCEGSTDLDIFAIRD